MAKERRYVRVAGPFEARQMGPIESRIAVCDLNEGGCFVRSARGSPAPGRSLVLKIILPDEGWICLKAEVLYVMPNSGFAVSFVDVPHRASDRLTRTLQRMRGEFADADKDRSLVLPACPQCRATAVRPLGMARSTLPWFACQRCDAVWAARDPEASASQLGDAATWAPQPGGVKQILVADDDGAILALFRKALSDYAVLTARDVAEALAVGRSASVDLLITDYLMPDGTGEELISRLRERQPSLKVLISTGHAAMLDQEGSDWWTHERHLSKPFPLADLRLAVTELIGEP